MHPLKKLGFLWSYSLAAMIVGAYYSLGPAGAWAGVAYVFVLIPLLDVLFGPDRYNVGHDNYENVLHDRFFDVVVYSFVYLQYALLVWAGYALISTPMSAGQTIGFVFGLGLFGGTMINVAHELGHRASNVAQAHAKAALAGVCYVHWLTEHVHGHHRHVATPEDPATARRGQSLYGFWWQSVVGGYRSAWQIEQKGREKNVGHVNLSGVEGRMRLHPMLPAFLWPALVCTALTAGFSLWAGRVTWEVPVFFLAQSLIAILLLESVNYVEHYGILRNVAPSGRYERVNPLHSWNASQLVSNLVLFQLQRHSDHHAYASRPYQVLRHFDESPQLPAGYPIMILLALLPPAWFALMHPRLDAWQARAHSADEITRVVRQFA